MPRLLFLMGFPCFSSFDQQGIKLQRSLTDRATECCGRPEHHAYQLFLAVEDIDHFRSTDNYPQTTGICEWFDKPLQDECYSRLLRKKRYRAMEELRLDLDVRLKE